MNRLRTVIIGSGNVAWALATGLREAGEPPLQIFARNRIEGESLAKESGSVWCGDPAQIAEADIYVIAVTDKNIAEVSGDFDPGQGVVAHTAGSVPVTEISSAVTDKAVIYPLQTFTKGRHVNWRSVPVFVEGTTDRSCEVATRFAALLSAKIYSMSSQNRAIVHTAAVFACNFTNYMYTVAAGLATEAGADFSVLKPLITETSAKAVATDSPAKVQTGPAARGDASTMKLHEKILYSEPDIQDLYKNISRLIWETSKKISRE